MNEYIITNVENLTRILNEERSQPSISKLMITADCDDSRCVFPLIAVDPRQIQTGSLHTNRFVGNCRFRMDRCAVREHWNTPIRYHNRVAKIAKEHLVLYNFNLCIARVAVLKTS